MTQVRELDPNLLGATIASAGAGPVAFFLHVTLPDTETREIPLAGRSLVVGRSPEADLLVPHGSVSRRHAEFEQRERDWWVRDLGSSNGTWVNGERVAERKLVPGDRVLLGEAIFNYRSIHDPEVRPRGMLRRAADGLRCTSDLLRHRFGIRTSERRLAALAKQELAALAELGNAALLVADHHPELAALPETIACRARTDAPQEPGNSSPRDVSHLSKTNLGRAVYSLGIAPVSLAELSGCVGAVAHERLRVAEDIGRHRSWLRGNQRRALGNMAALLVGFLLLAWGVHATHAAFAKSRGFDTDGVTEATPKVVIVAEAEDPQGKLYYQLVSGTAFAIEPRGYLLTNRHVVAEIDQQLAKFKGEVLKLARQVEGQGRTLKPGLARLYRTLVAGTVKSKIFICFSGEELYETRIVHQSRDADFAILCLDESQWSKVRPEWPCLHMAGLDDVRETMPVAAVGYPGVAESAYESNDDAVKRFLEGSPNVAGSCAKTAFKPTWTVGVVSKIADHVSNGTTRGRVVQTDANLNHGNSGGPLIDEQNRVLAINTFGAENVYGAIVLADLADEITKAITEDQKDKAVPSGVRRRPRGTR